MGFPELLGAVAEYVSDSIVNDCDRPVPDRVLRYHGPIPHDCCTENGFLAVSWERVVPSDERNTPCPGPPKTTIAMRYVVCWPIPDVGTGGVRLIDDSWDQRAAMLADVQDCVTRALIRLSCANTGDALWTEVLSETVCNAFRFTEAVPIPPGGGCAGVLWRASVGVRGGSAAS